MDKHYWTAAILGFALVSTANATNTLFDFSETIDSVDPITFELFGESVTIVPTPDELPTELSLLIEALPGDSLDRFDLRFSGAVDSPSFSFDFDETLEELPTFGLFEIDPPADEALLAEPLAEQLFPLLGATGAAFEAPVEAAAVATSAVPEPNAFVLLFLGLAGASGRRRAWV